jgi:hypothetical protein
LQVFIQHPKKVLTVSTDTPTWDEIIKAVEKAGYKAESFRMQGC